MIPRQTSDVFNDVMVPGARIELARFQESRDFKSLASTYSATQATETLCNMFKNTCQDFSFWTQEDCI